MFGKLLNFPELKFKIKYKEVFFKEVKIMWKWEVVGDYIFFLFGQVDKWLMLIHFKCGEFIIEL